MIERVRIIELCHEINKNSKCNCGGFCINSKCEICGKENEILNELINELEILLKNKKFENMEVLSTMGVYLYSLKDMKIDEINRFMDKTNYDELVKKEVKTFIQCSLNNMKIKNGNEILTLSYLNAIEDKDSKVRLLLLKEITENKIEASNGQIEQIAILYFKELLETMGNYQGEVTISSNLEEGTFIDKINNKIEISKNEIKKISKGEYNSFINITSKCLFKYMQEEFFKEEFISDYDIRKLKDYILETNLENYKEENKNVILTELEPTFYSLDYEMKLTRSLRVTCPLEEFDRKKEKLLEMNEDMSILNRTVNGEVININKLFDNFIKTRKELLDDYPQLKLEYKIKDNEVVNKTKEEINDEYEDYLNGKLDLNATNSTVEYYFKELLNRFNDEKKYS